MQIGIYVEFQYSPNSHLTYVAIYYQLVGMCRLFAQWLNETYKFGVTSNKQ